MYAVHLAVTAIQNGDCDSAIVAASNWIADPSLHIALDKLGALSATSACHTFDASADGYARGEGFAALYFKRLSVACTDGSPLRAVIRGTAVNANGRTGGITRPSVTGQEAAIRMAYETAGLSYSDTTYFECHGTGTPAGDPIELEAIARVFAPNQDLGRENREPLFIGSVKTNMGHAEGASALAAVMKVILSLEAGEIPPSYGVKILNPSINFEKAGVEVVRQVMRWPQRRPRRASINSFGFGGANGHCILESASDYLTDHPLLKSDNIFANAARSTFRQASNQLKPGTYVSSYSELNVFAPDKQFNGSHDNEEMIETHTFVNNGLKTNGIQEQHWQDRSHKLFINNSGSTSSPNATTRQLVLLPFSAHNESSLSLNIEALAREIQQHSLADVAYTLSDKRSKMPYRTVRIVNKDCADFGFLDVDSKHSIHTTSDTQKSSSVAFVFTGQGAQWHAMGAQLFEYRAFRAAIEYLDWVLNSLFPPNPNWSIIDILKGNCDPELINTPSVSQTVCTALQIGLVDLLASWSVRPSAVAGHSSGEIAAAYASGNITAADAIVAAYLRGQAVLKNKQKGAMLAVGLGPDQFRDSGYLNGEDKLQIAAVNSPASITVSGDELSVEALAARLSDDEVFHRLLKTGGNAYHSSHMNALGEEYERRLAHYFAHMRQSGIFNEQHLYPGVPWISSVHPDKDPPSSPSESAAYWRANLESPVQFIHATSKMVGSNENHARSLDPIKILVEIGPHAVLKGPLEQTLKSLGSNQVAYAGSTLKRGEDDLKSILELAGKLFCLNATISLVAVNAMDKETHSIAGDEQCVLVHGRVALDLPPYKYAYGPISYYECRPSKEYRLRKLPRHDLLGSYVPGVAKLRPQWRNMLRLRDLHWLGDHRLLPDAVFPAAGYIAMAIEAALRTYEEAAEVHQRPAGYAFRNVSIKTALRLPEDDHGIETLFTMELNDSVSNSNAMSSWTSFSICSVGQASVDSIDSTWTEHCTGMIKIDTGSSGYQSEGINTESMDARVFDARSWYRTFAAIGLGYGPAFQGLTDIRADPDRQLASATVALRKTSGAANEDESRYVLHPTTLDATFQLGLIACYGGRVETTTTAFVPVHFSQLYIGDGISDQCNPTASVVALGELRGLRGAYINKLQMMNEGGDILLDIERLRCISYTSETNIGHDLKGRYSSAFMAPFSRMVWKPDFRYISSSSCRTLFPPPENNMRRLLSVEKLSKLACCILVDIYETLLKQGEIETGLVSTPSDNTRYFSSWIKRLVVSASLPEIVQATKLSCQELRSTIRRLYQETREIPEAQIAMRLYENMADILSKRRTGVDIMVNSDQRANLLSALYEHGIFMTSAYPQLSRILDGLAHVNPHLRILEIGAGTGGATRVAMQTLTGPNGIKRYREYIFTDVSPGFLAAAQTSMSCYRDIAYSVLDIEADPTAQGFRPVYDIVLASQTLHATASISQTLKNCRKLLKPQGKLVLVENTIDNSAIIGLILGTLTGYWHGVLDGRVDSPFINVETWDRLLRKEGFSGIEMVLDDFPQPKTVTSTLVSTLLESAGGTQLERRKKKPLRDHDIQLLHSFESEPPLLTRFREELQKRGRSFQSARLSEAKSIVLPDANVLVFLNHTEKDFLLDSEGFYLDIFQHLARTATNVVCLTSSGFSKGRNPEGATIPAIFRTIGTENPAGRFISIDIATEDYMTESFSCSDLIRCVMYKVFPLPKKYEDDEETESSHIDDCEYIWQAGCLWVSRAVPDETLQSYAETSYSEKKLPENLSLQSLDSQGSVRAAFYTPGILSSLYFRPYTELISPISPNYIDVKVAAAGINWKDLVVSSGRFDANNLSSEYSGIVTSVGAGVVDAFSVGDRVYGMGRGHFGNYTRVPAVFAQKLDARDDMVDVATMPLVYMTAVYAFDHIARLRQGHKILIQSATGGLGLAAIHLARAKGAEVFAMVGTAEKANFLIEEMKLPKSHVIVVPLGDNSLDLGKRLSNMTPHNRGFDVILSTARGDLLHASIEALAPLGHFVDVGRTDVQDSKVLGMEVFNKGASFSSFDLSLVLEANPILGGELMKAVHTYYREGLIRPIHPLSATDVSNLDQTLLKFSKGTHIGKMVVTFQNPQALVKMPPASSLPRAYFEQTACYVIVGGLGGLGRSIVRWMSERGARNLIVLSRRPLEESSSTAQSLVDMLIERGINLQYMRCDVSDCDQVTRLVQDIASCYPTTPLKGIVHTAASYLDISFDKMTVPRWRDSLAAKVKGTRNLHEATLSFKLDFFVMITSLESVWALATQSAYTAANAFQDAFARYRRQLGLPATSVSFGFIREVGKLSQDSITVDMFARNKALTLSETEFLARLEPAFLPAANDCDDGCDGGWIGRNEDPLSASNILTCLDPGAMAQKERDDGAEVDAPSGGSTVPRWYSDPRVSVIMRAFEDAKQSLLEGHSSSMDDDNTGASEGKGGVMDSKLSSPKQIRRQFDAAISSPSSADARLNTIKFVTRAITTAVAEMLFVDVASVSAAKSVAAHGVDSLIAAELRNWFVLALGVRISMPGLLDARLGIDALAAKIVDEALEGRKEEAAAEN
ncbi:hypothetical protein F5Y19DRAFT_427873 [Xylariaceae sp. FL1651]|nr:hypothetical protein F5Y19DRAFT_427873 [Xylariaceae sp. FL1651]